MGEGLTLILSVVEGRLKLISLGERGVRLNFEHYFTHFQPPPPGNYCIVSYSLCKYCKKISFCPRLYLTYKTTYIKPISFIVPLEQFVSKALILQQ